MEPMDRLESDWVGKAARQRQRQWTTVGNGQISLENFEANGLGRISQRLDEISRVRWMHAIEVAGGF